LVSPLTGQTRRAAHRMSQISATGHPEGGTRLVARVLSLLKDVSINSVTTQYGGVLGG
jgi:hypothetical protein